MTAPDYDAARPPAGRREGTRSVRSGARETGQVVPSPPRARSKGLPMRRPQL